MISALGLRAAAGVPAARRDRVGRPNASVLPEPVWPRPRTSLPAMASGMVATWIGNGVVMPSRARRATSCLGSPRAAKPLSSATVTGGWSVGGLNSCRGARSARRSLPRAGRSSRLNERGARSSRLNERGARSSRFHSVRAGRSSRLNERGARSSRLNERGARSSVRAGRSSRLNERGARSSRLNGPRSSRFHSVRAGRSSRLNERGARSSRLNERGARSSLRAGRSSRLNERGARSSRLNERGARSSVRAGRSSRLNERGRTVVTVERARRAVVATVVAAGRTVVGAGRTVVALPLGAGRAVVTVERARGAVVTVERARRTVVAARRAVVAVERARGAVVTAGRAGRRSSYDADGPPWPRCGFLEEFWASAFLAVLQRAFLGALARPMCLLTGKIHFGTRGRHASSYLAAVTVRTSHRRCVERAPGGPELTCAARQDPMRTNCLAARASLTLPASSVSGCPKSTSAASVE